MKCHLAAFLSLLLVHVIDVLGEQKTLGRIFKSNAAREGGAKGIFLMDDIVLGDGVVYQFAARFVRTNPVRLQVWRPVNESLRMYKLVGETKYTPYIVPIEKVVPLYGNWIFTKQGDRLAIFNEEDTDSIAYSLVPQPNNPLYHHTPKDPSGLKDGTTVRFGSLSLPYQFAVTVSFDTVIAPYLQPYTGATPGLPGSTPEASTITAMPPSMGTQQYTGNQLTGKSKIMRPGAKRVFILQNAVLKKGVVTKFYGYFMRTDPVFFQIWRSYARDERYYLVGQVRYAPRQAPALIEVVLNKDQYIFVEDNDILGFTNEKDVGPLGYSFILDTKQHRPYSAAVRGTNYPKEGHIWSFDVMGHPYDFAVGVMYDTDLNPAKYGAFVTVTPVPPTIQPLQTTTKPRIHFPPPNPFGVRLGHNLVSSDRYVGEGAKRTWLLKGMPVPYDGYIAAFAAFFVNNGDVQFQIWRPQKGSDVHTLIALEDFSPSRTPSFQQVTLKRTAWIKVKKGDLIGYLNKETMGAIGYHFPSGSKSPSVNLYSAPPMAMKADQTMRFEFIPMPYKFVIAVSFMTDAEVRAYDATTRAPTSPVATSKSTSESKKSLQPSTKLTSSPTEATQKPIPASNAIRTDLLSWITNPNLILGLFIWLVVITILFLVMCLYMVCRRRAADLKFGTGSGRHLSGYHQWLGSMKDDEVIDYFNPTIGHGRQTANGSNGNINANNPRS